MELSELQTNFLQWLADGNLFETCTETKGSLFGTNIGLHKFEGKYCKRTLARLLKEGFVQSKPIKRLLVNFNKITVTDKGKATLKLIKLKKLRGIENAFT